MTRDPRRARNVQLRNAHLAIVERHKLLEYLLIAAHPDDGGKAQFFESLGFRSENPELVVGVLQAVVQTGEVVEMVESSTARNMLSMDEYRLSLSSSDSHLDDCDLSFAVGEFFAELIILPLQALDFLRGPRIGMRGAIGRSPFSLHRALGPSRTHSPYGTPVTLGLYSLLRELYVTYRSEKWSGRLDSNQRPPAPKAGALPGCATPRLL
jgi:hypothetical protein